MSSFDPAFRRTMNFEGITLENVPGDPGGLTFCGIARNPQPNWNGWPLIDQYLAEGPDFRTAREKAINDASLMALVEQFYKTSIWDANNLGQLTTQELSNQVYDAIVNIGDKVVKWLQVLVKATPDGDLGPLTVDACNRAPQNEVVDDFIIWRKNYYISLVAEKPDMGKFLNGWLKRCVRSDALPAA